MLKRLAGSAALPGLFPGLAFQRGVIMGGISDSSDTPTRFSDSSESFRKWVADVRGCSENVWNCFETVCKHFGKRFEVVWNHCENGSKTFYEYFEMFENVWTIDAMPGMHFTN